MKKSLFIFALLLSIQGIAQKSLTLRQCVELAWANNLQIKQAELSVESSEASLQNTKANVLPNLNGFASHNYNWGQRIDPFTNQFANTRVQSNSFGLSSSIDLFNGFQNQQNIKAQSAALESVVFNLEAQKNDISLAVSGSFLATLLAQELVSISEQQVQITKQQLDRIKILVDAGSINIGNQYNLEAQLAQDESNLIARENDYQLSILSLKQLLLLPMEEELIIVRPTTLEIEPSTQIENSQVVYSYAESSMPEIKSAERSLMQWDSRLKSAKGGRYPSLTLSGSIGSGYSGLRTEVVDATLTGSREIGATQTGELVFAPIFDTELRKVNFGTQLNDNFNQFVGLSLNVPIFNRGAVNNSVKQAQINQDIAELQLEQEKQSLRQTIESARADAIAARALYLSNQRALASNEKAFEFATARFEAGALNVLEFNTAKNNLQVSQTQLNRAKYDFIFKTKVLDFYMGKPLSFE
ncbi:TolC family protein [Salibacteraceae bacterium]|nr:TolC family protein [Salibacteraceae bacterium]